MFERLNELAAKLVSVSVGVGRKLLASEVYSLLPVEDYDGAKMLGAQLRVIKSGLRQSPNKKVETALDDVFQELAIAARAAWSE